MTSDKGIPSLLEELLIALVDGQLTKDQERQLGDLLDNDRDNQQYYLDFISTDAQLHQELGGCLFESLEGQVDSPFSEVKQTGGLDRSGGSSPVLGFLGGVASFVSHPVFAAVVVVSLLIPLGLLMLGVLPMPVGRQHDIVVVPKAKAVARVTGLDEGCRWRENTTAWALQSNLKAGEQLHLTSGLVQVEFGNGAKVLVEGPASFAVTSSSVGSLERGRLTARVPKRAKGFAIETPSGRVVDMGTEFGVDVTDGKSFVSVFVGQVEVQSSKQRATNRETKKLVAGQAAQIHQGTGKITDADANGNFVRNWPAATLRITPQYVAAVKAAKPFAYWRFESDENNVVPNEMGERYPLQVVGKITLEPAGPGNHAAQFWMNVSGEYRFDRYLTATGPFDELVEKDYTFELWVNPDSRRWQTLLGMTDAGSTITSLRTVHFAVLELLAGGSVRFVHRSTPAQKGGTDLVSEPTEVAGQWQNPGGADPVRAILSKGVRTGQWQHLVGVKSSSGLALYLNGSPIGAASDPSHFSVAPMELTIGKLGTERRDQVRAYYGQLDEIAVYNRALSAEQVREHYSLARPAEAASGKSIKEMRSR